MHQQVTSVWMAIRGTHPSTSEQHQRRVAWPRTSQSPFGGRASRLATDVPCVRRRFRVNSFQSTGPGHVLVVSDYCFLPLRRSRDALNYTFNSTIPPRNDPAATPSVVAARRTRSGGSLPACVL